MTEKNKYQIIIIILVNNIIYYVQCIHIMYNMYTALVRNESGYEDDVYVYVSVIDNNNLVERRAKV